MIDRKPLTTFLILVLLISGFDMALGGTLASVAGWVGLLIFVGWLVVSKRVPVPTRE